MKKFGVLTTLILAATIARAGVYKIGGISFDEANTIKTAALVEGPLILEDHNNPRFGRYSESYILSLESRTNEFQNFERNRSVAVVLGRVMLGGLARHICFPETGDKTGIRPIPNVHRCGIEFTWAGFGLPNNGKGDDLVVYESGTWEGFAVAVRKVNSLDFTGYRYHFPRSFDATHNVNTVTFDLSDFEIGPNEAIAAVRIRNLFNAQARSGGDKVDNQTGQGWLIYPGDPRYKEAFLIRSRPGGPEFRLDQLGSDIIYVAGLQTIVPLKNFTNPNQPAAADAASSGKQDAVSKK